MKRIIVLALLLLSAGLIRGQAAEFSAGDCPFTNNSHYQIDCGFVTVPADHAAPEGASLQLAVAIIRSNNPDKAPDPVLYLEGGPGGAPVQYAPIIGLQYPFLGVALQNRDVILVDQRGMGYSQPTFYCSPFRTVDEAFTSDYFSLFMNRMPDCLAQFEAQGIDWRLFTTEQNALDLAMLGQALGYEQVNLQGSSYGTLLGLIILREHPEVVRSAILDSVLIPAAQPFASSATDFEAAFAQMEANCAADIACSLAYPNLRESFIASYERLAANPETMDVNGRTVPVTAAFVAGRVRYMLASIQTARLVPAFIVGVANRDYEVVREFVEAVNSVEVTELPNQALYMTMVCPQGVSEFANTDSPFQAGGFSNLDNQLCQAWGEVLPFDSTMPVSAVPVLVLSGELDPLTPPAWSALAAESLSQSTRLVFPNTSHLVLQGVCGQSIALDFLNNPTAQLNTSCISGIPSIAFILHTTVTRLPIQIAAGLLSLWALFGMGQMTFAGLRGLKRTAWWASFRKMGWMPLIALLALLFLVYSNAKVLPPEFVSVGVVQSMLPLFMGLQVAAVFNPSDEPSLEIQMAAPRSILWLLAERIFVVVLTYSVIALLGIGLSLWLEPVQNMPVLFLGWLPPALFLSGLGVFVTVRSRMLALGVLLIGFLWFIFALFAPMFLPGQSFPAPFHLIQPFMWSIHLHASLNDLAAQDFWLNRLFLTAAGLSFMILAARSLRDSEELLLGIKARKSGSKKAEFEAKRELKPSLSLQPVMVKLQPLMQILGIIRYEFIMRWRTRALKVIVLTPVVMMLIFSFALNAGEFLPSLANSALNSPEFNAYAFGELFMVLAAMILFVPSCYLFPIIVSDAFPSDKRLGVDELLNALPLSFETQVIGRLLGTVLAGITALWLAILIMFGLWMLRVGMVSVLPMLDLGIGAALICALLTGITLVLGALQSSSRRAIALAIGVLFLPEFLQSIPLVHDLLPSRAGFILSYFGGLVPVAQANGMVQAHQFVILQSAFLQLLGANALLLLGIGIVVWAWHKFKK